MNNKVDIIKNLKLYVPLDAQKISFFEKLMDSLNAMGFEYFAIKNSIYLYYDNVGICRFKFSYEDEIVLTTEKIKKVIER